jgi:hypothetical protein
MNRKFVQIAIDAGMPCLQDDRGMNPFHHAVLAGKPRILKMLLGAYDKTQVNQP